MKAGRILKITWTEIKLTFSGFGRFYIEYFRALNHIRLHPLAIVDWLVMAMFLLILVLHPFFPPAFKLLSSLFVILVSYFKTKNFVKNARFQPQKQHARIRGGILALFPFYLVAVTTFIWGLWEVWPNNDYQAQQLKNAELVTKDQEGGNENPEMKDHEITPGQHSGDYKVIREQKGNPLLNVLNDAYPRKTPPDKEFVPEYDNALTFWIYSLKVALGMNFAGITEFVYNNAFIDEEAGDKRLYITRLDGWHEFMLVLEVILQLITSILFLGIIADIALSVQRKIQTGEIDIDLSRDYAIELLKGVKNLDSLAEVDVAVESWNKIKDIQERAIENLLEKIQIELPVSYIDNENIALLRNTSVMKKVSAVLTLGNFREKKTLQPLVELFESDSLRVRCAAMEAVAKIDVSAIAKGFANLFNDGHEIQKFTLLKVLESTILDAQNNEGNKFTISQIQNLFAEKLVSTLDESDILRNLTISILARFDAEHVCGILMTAFESSKIDSFKAAVVYTLGALNFESVLTDNFTKFVNDESDEIVGAVLTAARFVNTDKFNDKILEIAQNKDTDEGLRNSAILALGNGSVSLISELMTFLEDDSLKLSTLTALSQIINNASGKKLNLPEDFFDRLQKIIENSDDKQIREQACLTLAKTKDAKALSILVNALPKPEAAYALGILGDPDVVQNLVETAKETADMPVYSMEHIAPIEALGNLGIDGLKALQELYGKRRKERAYIALVIAKTKLPQAVDFLLGKFHPESLESCKILAPALANTQDNRVKRPLLNAVTQNPDAAGVITQALLGFEDEVMVEEILKLISAFNDEVRNEVFEIFKFYRPKQKNADVIGNMQKYFGTISSKAESWAKKLNKILQKHTVIHKRPEPERKQDEKINLEALDEFD